MSPLHPRQRFSYLCTLIIVLLWELGIQSWTRSLCLWAHVLWGEVENRSSGKYMECQKVLSAKVKVELAGGNGREVWKELGCTFPSGWGAHSGIYPQRCRGQRGCRECRGCRGCTKCRGCWGCTRRRGCRGRPSCPNLQGQSFLILAGGCRKELDTLSLLLFWISPPYNAEAEKVREKLRITAFQHQMKYFPLSWLSQDVQCLSTYLFLFSKCKHLLNSSYAPVFKKENIMLF